MNSQMVSILFLKDLFLSRRTLFAYLLGGIASILVTCIPNETVAFIGFLLIVTVSIGMGIHLISELILEERKSHTLPFVMSLPISIADYSIAKISVVLLTYLIPWFSMLVGFIFLTVLLPWAKSGMVTIYVVIFCELLASFAIQLVVAVVSESIGWTIVVMVAGNVFLNVFLMYLFRMPEIVEATKLDLIVWTPTMGPLLAIEWLAIVASIVIAMLVQSRKSSFI